MGDFPAGELSQIILRRADKDVAVPLIVAKQIEQLYVQLQQNDSIEFTMRDIIKWLRRHNQPGSSSAWWISGLLLLYPRIQARSEESARLIETFAAIEGWAGAASFKLDSVVDMQQTVNGVTMVQGPYKMLVEGAQLGASSLFGEGRRPPQSFLRALMQLAVAAQHQEPVLLVGPTSFKSLLVKTWAAITGKDRALLKVHLSADTEVSELVGQIQPTTAVKLLQELPALAEKFAASIGHGGLYEDPIERGRRHGLNAHIRALQDAVEAAVADYEERYRSQLSPRLSSQSNLPSDEFGMDDPTEFCPVDISAYRLPAEAMSTQQAQPEQPSAAPLGESWQLPRMRSVISKSSASSSSSSSSEESRDAANGMDFTDLVLSLAALLNKWEQLLVNVQVMWRECASISGLPEMYWVFITSSCLYFVQPSRQCRMTQAADCLLDGRSDLILARTPVRSERAR